MEVSPEEPDFAGSLPQDKTKKIIKISKNFIFLFYIKKNYFCQPSGVNFSSKNFLVLIQ
jgi:hypothetical protein